MSNYAYGDVLDGAVTIGPETVNGTGQVYLYAEDTPILSNERARELAAALIAAADYAKAVQEEKENWAGGRPPKSVLDVPWTDPQWRSRWCRDSTKRLAENSLEWGAAVRWDYSGKGPRGFIS